MVNLLDLPNEILLHIASYIPNDYFQVKDVEQVCKRFGLMAEYLHWCSPDFTWDLSDSPRIQTLTNNPHLRSHIQQVIGHDLSFQLYRLLELAPAVKKLRLALVPEEWPLLTGHQIKPILPLSRLTSLTFHSARDDSLYALPCMLANLPPLRQFTLVADEWYKLKDSNRGLSPLELGRALSRHNTTLRSLSLGVRDMGAFIPEVFPDLVSYKQLNFLAIPRHLLVAQQETDVHPVLPMGLETLEIQHAAGGRDRRWRIQEYEKMLNQLVEVIIAGRRTGLTKIELKWNEPVVGLSPLGGILGRPVVDYVRLREAGVELVCEDKHYFDEPDDA